MSLLRITTIENRDEERIKTLAERLDEFLGGGFINSQMILLAGQPGAGKSTLLLQLAKLLVDKGSKVLYFSGEESLEQIKTRANRLGTLRDDIWCSDDIELSKMLEIIKEVDPKFVFVDSIQMIYSKDITGPRGSKKQIEGCFLQLIDYLKKTGRIMVAIGHSTKTGVIAGSNTLQHMPDTTLFMKNDNGFRTLISKKNRFGSTDITLPLTMAQGGFKELLPLSEQPQRGFFSNLFGSR